MINQWDKYATLYDKGIGDSGDDLHKKLINPIIFYLIGNYKNKTVLDAGCGNGYLLKQLSAHTPNCQLYGIDSSNELLKFAQENLNNKRILLKKENLTKILSLNSNLFDIVIVNMVLQYLPELDTFAKEIHRILKPNGMLVVIIDHPAHSLFLRAQELIGKKNEKFIDSGSYFTEEKRTKKSLWDKAILEYYHHPIKSYINTFTSFFKLDKMEEKTEDNEIPRILGLKWIKI